MVVVVLVVCACVCGWEGAGRWARAILKFGHLLHKVSVLYTEVTNVQERSVYKF